MGKKPPKDTFLGVVEAASPEAVSADSSLIFGSVQKTANRSVQIVAWPDAGQWAFGVLEHSWKPNAFLQGMPQSVTLYRCKTFNFRDMAQANVDNWSKNKFFSDVARALIMERGPFEEMVPAEKRPAIAYKGDAAGLPFALPPLINRQAAISALIPPPRKPSPFALIVT